MVRDFERPVGAARSCPWESTGKNEEGDCLERRPKADGRPDDVRRAVADMDGVFHMAVLNLNFSTQNPRLCLDINVDAHDFY